MIKISMVGIYSGGVVISINRITCNGTPVVFVTKDSDGHLQGFSACNQKPKTKLLLKSFFSSCGSFFLQFRTQSQKSRALNIADESTFSAQLMMNLG